MDPVAKLEAAIRKLEERGAKIGVWRDYFAIDAQIVVLQTAVWESMRLKYSPHSIEHTAALALADAILAVRHG